MQISCLTKAFSMPNAKYQQCVDTNICGKIRNIIHQDETKIHQKKNERKKYIAF